MTERWNNQSSKYSSLDLLVHSRSNDRLYPSRIKRAAIEFIDSRQIMYDVLKIFFLFFHLNNSIERNINHNTVTFDI